MFRSFSWTIIRHIDTHVKRKYVCKLNIIFICELTDVTILFSMLPPLSGEGLFTCIFRRLNVSLKLVMFLKPWLKCKIYKKTNIWYLMLQIRKEGSKICELAN